MKKRNNGYAMASTLALSAILILAVGVMLYKVNSNTKDIVRSKLNSQSLNVAEEGIEHTINWLNVQNTSSSQPPSLSSLLVNSNLSLPGVISLSNNVFKSTRDLGQFEIQLSSVGTATAQEDFIQLKAIGYIPNKTNFKSKKTVTVVIRRPLIINASLDNAIISDGPINMGNADTDSGYTPTAFTSEGDIHSNTSINLGANSDINGDATAVNGITGLAPGKVSGTSDPSSDEKPAPKPSYEINSTPCVMTASGGKKIYSPPSGLTACTYTGNLPESANDNVVIEGTVYVTGSVSSSGNTTFESSGTLSKLIVEGNVGFSGNASATPLTSKFMVVSRNGNVTISGNGSVYGIVFQENPSKSITINGSGNTPVGIFGAIVAAGTVTLNANKATVVRDMTLSSLNLSYDPNARIVRVNSWKLDNN